METAVTWLPVTGGCLALIAIALFVLWDERRRRRARWLGGPYRNLKITRWSIQPMETARSRYELRAELRRADGRKVMIRHTGGTQRELQASVRARLEAMDRV